MTKRLEELEKPEVKAAIVDETMGMVETRLSEMRERIIQETSESRKRDISESFLADGIVGPKEKYKTWGICLR